MADKTGYVGRNPGDSSVLIARQTFEPTGIQTDFTFATGYTVGYLDLFLNGSKLIEGNDYTATDGATVGLTTYAQSGDILELVAYTAFNLGDPVSSAAGNFTVGNSLTVNNLSTLVDVTVSGGSTFTGILDANNHVSLGSTVGVAGSMYFGDDQGLVLGDSRDLQIIHNGSDSIIKDLGTGSLKLQDGATTRLQVTSTGVVITGVCTATSYEGDGSALTGIAATDNIAAGSLTVSGISTLTGQLNAGAIVCSSVSGDGSGLTGVASTDVVHTRALTNSGVSTLTGTLYANGWVSCGDTVALGDSKALYFGADEDLAIYHDGSHSYIKDAGTGELKVHSDFFIIQNAAANETQFSCDEGAAVKSYYANSLKLETTLTGAKTTGVSSCTSHCMPTADVGGDLGSTTNRWANVYTADMQLSNEGSQNDIDGTWGKYTIQEGENDLFLINRRTGKKYKFMLEEVQ